MIKYTKEDLAFIKNSRAEQHKTSASLEGKRCVISGATSGVGLAAAMRLAKAGAEITLVARNQEKAKQVSQKIAEISGKAPDIFIADFSVLASVKSAAESITKAYDTIDILITSAGLHSKT